MPQKFQQMVVVVVVAVAAAAAAVVRMTFSFEERFFSCPIERDYPCKSSTDPTGSSRRNWNVHWLMPCRYNRRFRDTSISANFVTSLLTDIREFNVFHLAKIFGNK
jgi:hypothetical protein